MNIQNNLLKLWQDYDGYNNPNITDSSYNWLSNLTYSQAYVVCIGAGPWKINRRFKIQMAALNILRNESITDLDQEDFEKLCNVYPFQWQKDYITKAHKLCENLAGFDFFVLNSINSINPRTSFYQKMNCKPIKVLELFLRDSLHIDSFAIDRHVKRALKKYNIPPNPDLIISNCNVIKICPRQLSRLLFMAKSKNPNYGDKNESKE